MSIIAKYKFDSSVYADLIPEFNAEFTPDKYNTTDEEVDGIITRTIESDELPTLMRFGRVWVSGESATDNRTDSLLEVLDMNTSGLTNCSSMFRYCTNLTSITCEWDTSNVTNMYAMFTYCFKLTALDVSNFNASKVTNMGSMFSQCYNLTTLDVSNFDTSNVANMNNMFYNCNSLTSLDVSNFNTSNVTNMQSMFYNCNSLTSLDVSNFNTSNVTNMYAMFNNTPLLTDIGMLYCNQSTIETIASVLPTNITQTIWVEDIDVKDLTPVEGVEFKQYAKNTEIMLNSPLLEGDKLVVKDGKLCHYHKMGKIVLDGSESWIISTNTDNYLDFRIYNIEKPLSGGYGICDRFEYLSNQNGYWIASEEGLTAFTDNKNNLIIFSIQKSKLSTHDINGFKQWLQANPTTVVYELASPYYEVISEDPLDISIISETVDITNSSNIPLNMAISNSGMSTIAIKPSTTYTVAFDKEGEEDLTVNLCGNEITTSNNVVEITTSSELGNDELIFYGDGVEVSNVRLLEGGVSGDSVPKESFEGLKNSFEDNLVTQEMVDSGEESAENLGKYKVEYKVINEDNTKEYTKTFYLNSPLLEGDTIEDVNGVATHVKRMGKVVLDGSENWIDDWNSVYGNDFSFVAHTKKPDKKHGKSICDKFPSNYMLVDNKEGVITSNGAIDDIGIRILKTKASTLVEFKQWLSENPVTVVYELAEPIYEPISTESILCDSYVNGHLDFDSAVPIEKVEFTPTVLKYKYLQINTPYTLQFESDNKGKIDNIRVGTWTPQLGITNIVKGINKVVFTSPQNIEYPLIDIRGIGFNASNIQVVATDRDADFGYFKGLQNSFESELVTDENDENYGKYKVECTITNEDNSEMYTKVIYLNNPLLKGDTIEVHGGKLCHYHKMGMRAYEEGDLDLYITDLVNTVYELAEPYYEEITPTQEDLIITSVKEGDLHIDTIVPISSKVTYNVNVQLLTDFEQSIVEQVQATQTTDLQSILDEEIDN